MIRGPQKQHQRNNATNKQHRKEGQAADLRLTLVGGGRRNVNIITSPPRIGAEPVVLTQTM